MHFDKIVPNVQQILPYHLRHIVRTCTHRKCTYTYRFIVLLDGRMALHADEQAWECQVGDVIYLPAGQEYSTDFTPPCFHSINFAFDMIQNSRQGDGMGSPRNKYILSGKDIKVPEFFSDKVSFDDQPAFNHCFVAHNFPGATNCAYDFYQLWNSSDPYARLLLNAKMIEFLIDVARHIGKTKKTPRAAVAKRIVDYLDAHYAERLTCGEIADIFSYHPASVNRMMQEFYGCSLHDAILRAKIRGAMQLLLESDMSITEIAYHLSFYDSAHFSRQFKAITGRNPSDIRKKEW